MLTLAIFLFTLALLLLWFSRLRQKQFGIPPGRIIYTDTRTWQPTSKALYDAELGLTGKPDYLVEKDGQIIPVEVKSRRVSDAPYDAHIFQLAAYCCLVQRNMGKRPSYGILHYANRTFAIDYTPQLEATLLHLLDEIRDRDRDEEVMRSHSSVERCHRCGYRSTCDQQLI